MEKKSRNEILAPATKSFYKVREFNTIKELLQQTCDLYGERNAFEIKTKNSSRLITFNEYVNDINALGTALLSMGYKGKHLAISANNRYEWCLSYMAIINGVGVAVPIDKELLFPDINGILDTSDSTLIFCDKQLLKVLEKDRMNPDIKIVCFDYEEDELLDMGLTNDDIDVVRNSVVISEEEEVEEFECPICHSILPAGTSVCPSCGAEFEFE